MVVLAWLVAGFLEPSLHYVSWSGNCNFALEARGIDARFYVFNDAEYGPYRGSIIYIEGLPNKPTVSGFGDYAGVYYRHITWPSGGLLWTLSLSLAYPLLVSLVLPAIWLIRHKRLAAKQSELALKRNDPA